MPERDAAAVARGSRAGDGRRDVTTGGVSVDRPPHRVERGVPPLRVEVVASLDDLRDEWTRLAAASGNVFATWEWAAAWCEHHGRGRPLAIAALTRGDGAVAGILPLYRFARRPARAVRLVGHGPADQQGPICAPVDDEEVMLAVRPAVAAAGADVALLERLPGDVDWAAGLGGRVLAREASPVLAFGAGGWDELLAGWSANRRGQARRVERRLAREHDHRYILTQDRESLGGDLDVLFALHRSRWGQDSPFLADMAFHRDFAATALERGWLRLWRLEVDGRPAAAWYGLRFGGADSYYQAGRDPGMEDRAVGLALLLHTIRSALEDGASEYRFLRGDEPFKMRFASHDPGIVTIGLGTRATGRALVALVDMLARSPARRLLRGAAR